MTFTKPVDVSDWTFTILGSNKITAKRGDGWWILSQWQVIRGRLEPVNLEFTSPPGQAISTDTIRKLPIGSILHQARQTLIRQPA